MNEIHRLDDAANFLMLVSDQQVAENCNLKSSLALELMQPLHALIDTELEKIKPLITDKHLMLCEENCHCGLYSDLAQNAQLQNDLFKKAESFPKTQLIKCAQKTAVWFCHDELLDNLKKELEANSSNAL